MVLKATRLGPPIFNDTWKITYLLQYSKNKDTCYAAAALRIQNRSLQILLSSVWLGSRDEKHL